MCLNVARSNNIYLEAVEEYKGCPIDIWSLILVQKTVLWLRHAFIRGNPGSHRYVPSLWNQRIEGWWSFFCRSHVSWWMNFFKDLCDQGTIDLTSQLEKECTWFCFGGLLKQYLNEVKVHWSTHYIRGSRHDTIKGRSDSFIIYQRLTLVKLTFYY